jgi:hypothetical protein
MSRHTFAFFFPRLCPNQPSRLCRHPSIRTQHSLRNIQLKIRAGQAEAVCLRFIVRTGVPNTENWLVSEHAQRNTSFSNMGGAFFNFTNGGSSL